MDEYGCIESSDEHAGGFGGIMESCGVEIRLCDEVGELVVAVGGDAGVGDNGGCRYVILSLSHIYTSNSFLFGFNKRKQKLIKEVIQLSPPLPPRTKLPHIPRHPNPFLQNNIPFPQNEDCTIDPALS